MKKSLFAFDELEEYPSSQKLINENIEREERGLFLKKIQNFFF